MKPWFVLFVLVAGCADVDDGREAPAPEPTTEPSIPDLFLTLDPIAITYDDTVLVRGSVSAPAALTVQRVQQNGAPDDTVTVEAAGAFEVPMRVDHGHNLFHVLADDGLQGANATVLAIRLYDATFEVTFRGDAETKKDRNETVPLDMGELTSKPLYDGCDVEHPGTFVVHDAMLQWATHSNVAVDYSDCSQFGFGVNAIDGHASPGSWCYTVDGEAADFGISLQPMGTRVAWDDCALVLG